MTPADRKLMVIGLDGLDPALVEKYMAEGLLPNLKSLTETGTLGRLATSNPPQSPVAWSCLISGGNPGHHDVFDFVVRDPVTHLPEIGMTQTKKAASGLKEIFAGLTGPSIQTRRKGGTFWDVLGKNKIKSVILRMPVTFPAEPLEGRLLSGMGTPDIRGTQGVFSYYTTSPIKDQDSRGKLIPVTWDNETIDTEVIGPRLQAGSGQKSITAPMRVTRKSPTMVHISVGESSFDLKVGEWSPWVRLSFKVNVLSDIRGVCRFHLNTVSPELALFATPVNIDPQKPAMPISFPSEYAKEMFEKVGNFYTQGMPYDTWAMNEGRLTEEQFLEQAYSILEENRAMMKVETARFDKGLLFCYFGITDLVQHMFWRYIDPDHPSKGLSQNPAVRNAIRDVYHRIDDVIGEAVAQVGNDTAVLVVSDHGFGSFRRAAHVNSWLRDHGYLALRGGDKAGGDFFVNVAWEKTHAYSVGFGGIYLNQFGRESDGIVYKGAEAEQLKKEIIDGLMQWRDNGHPVVKHVYRREELYHGPYENDGPDLFIGFEAGYRASWQSGLGASPEGLVEDNLRAWTGDHLCDPSLVPGVIASNLKLNASDASLLDISPTILKFFGLAPAGAVEGKPLN